MLFKFLYDVYNGSPSPFLCCKLFAIIDKRNDEGKCKFCSPFLIFLKLVCHFNLEQVFRIIRAKARKRKKWRTIWNKCFIVNGEGEFAVKVIRVQAKLIYFKIIKIYRRDLKKA